MNTSPETIRAAAARWHQHCIGPASPYDPDGDSQWLADMAMLSNAYIAEHPTDDETPVDEAWLTSVGFAKRGIDLYLPLSDDGSFVTRLYVVPPHPRGCQDWYFRLVNKEDRQQYFRAYMPQFHNTRGEVRRLCRALGVELKEGST